ncbi:hypothetical protein VKS41_003604 [Umbelopsis sp. WA50703]
MTGAPAVLGQTTLFGGYNNSGLYVFSGQINSATGVKDESSTLYLFNTTSYSWTTVPRVGTWPLARDSASGVARVSSGIGYVFGGEPQMNGSTWLYNSTWSLQYGTTWSQIGGMAPSGGRQSHGAVMLSDGRMVILGGADHLGNAIALSSVLIFDTNTQQYTTMNASLSGTNPIPRLSFAMVSTFDDKIIIHGGDGGNGQYLADLAVLDMKQSSLSWTVPASSGTTPPGRLSHIGIMVGSQVFIMYGQTSASSVDNGVYVIDTNTWAWQTTYTPQNLEYTNTGVLSPSGANTSTESNSTTGSSGNANGNGESSESSKAPSGAIIGGSVGGAVAVLALAGLAAGVWIRRRRRNGEVAKSSVYHLPPETEPHNAPLAGNMYDSAPPYYPQYSAAANVSARDSSTAVNSLGDSASYRLTEISQKPNVPNHSIYQKPNAED